MIFLYHPFHFDIFVTVNIHSACMRKSRAIKKPLSL